MLQSNGKAMLTRLLMNSNEREKVKDDVEGTGDSAFMVAVRGESHSTFCPKSAKWLGFHCAKFRTKFDSALTSSSSSGTTVTESQLTFTTCN